MKFNPVAPNFLRKLLKRRAHTFSNRNLLLDGISSFMWEKSASETLLFALGSRIGWSTTARNSCSQKTGIQVPSLQFTGYVNPKH